MQIAPNPQAASQLCSEDPVPTGTHPPWVGLQVGTGSRYELGAHLCSRDYAGRGHMVWSEQWRHAVSGQWP